MNHIKKFVHAICLLVLIIIFFLICLLISSKDSETTANYHNQMQNVRILGRFYEDSDIIWLDYTNAGIEFYYECTQVGGIHLQFATSEDFFDNPETCARVGVFINDDETPAYETILSNKEALKCSYYGAIGETVKIKVIKLSEMKYGNFGIKKLTVSGGKVYPTEDKEVKIEFIGDSITSGNGNEASGKDNFSTSTENGNLTFGAILSRMLDADANFVCFSGIGIWHSRILTDQTMPDIYEYVSPFHEIKWDFQSFKPNYIVINLGTNDSKSLDDTSADDFKEDYRDFLNLVLLHNPDAKIICTVGPMNYACEELIKDVVNDFGYNSVMFFKFEPMTEIDVGGAGHPNGQKHREMAKELYDFIISQQ